MNGRKVLATSHGQVLIVCILLVRGLEEMEITMMKMMGSIVVMHVMVIDEDQ